MGNTVSCWEAEGWDAHPDIKLPYRFPEGPAHDMTQPLSHYFISSGRMRARGAGGGRVGGREGGGCCMGWIDHP